MERACHTDVTEEPAVNESDDGPTLGMKSKYWWLTGGVAVVIVFAVLVSATGRRASAVVPANASGASDVPSSSNPGHFTIDGQRFDVAVQSVTHTGINDPNYTYTYVVPSFTTRATLPCTSAHN
jgi:hypothetical protein